MQTMVADHPLVAHKLTALRDVRTPTYEFRRLADELVTLLAYEATRHLQVDLVTIETPVAAAEGVKLAGPPPLIVPVLRAGIGMLDGMTRLLPGAAVGFVGLARDEETLVASTYAARLPADLTGREAFVLDPMLATGGTLETVIRMLIDRNRHRVRRWADARPGPGGHRGGRRPAERTRLHRARPRGRRRPPVRHDLTRRARRTLAQPRRLRALARRTSGGAGLRLGPRPEARPGDTVAVT
jgi:uracil phosphoribosyltransferase